MRFYPPFGVCILDKEYCLTRFNHQKEHYSTCNPVHSLLIILPGVSRALNPNGKYVGLKFKNLTSGLGILSLHDLEAGTS